MATREELLAEAYKRGILTDDMKAAYEEHLARKDPAQKSWGDVAMQGVVNFPSSAWDAVKDTASTFLHPIETVKALGKMVGGAAVKMLLPDSVQWDEGEYLPSRAQLEGTADAVGQYIANRYGSEDGLKRAFALDPAGVLADLSMVFTGGGGAVRGLAKGAGTATKIGKALDAAGTAMGDLGMITDPVSIAVKAADAVTPAAVGLESGAKKLYQSALRPNVGFSNNGKPRYSPEEITDMVNAGLERRIPVTSKGERIAGEAIRGINDEVEGAIKAADDAGLELSPSSIANRTLYSDRRDNRVAKQADPASDIRGYDRSVGNFWAYHGGDKPLSFRDAQDIKKNTYAKLEGTYKNNAKPMNSGSIEAQKEIARQLRIAINDNIDTAIKHGVLPPLKGGKTINDLNHAEGALIDLKDNIGRAFQNSGNRSPLDFLTGSMVAAGTGDIGKGLGASVLKPIIMSPGMMSRGAFLLDDISKQGNPFRFRLGALRLANQPGIIDAMKKEEGK